MYQVFPNIIPQENFIELSNLLSNGSWTFTGNSGDGGFTFWYKDLINESMFREDVFNLICTQTNKKFKLLQVYANGQTHGQPGHLHLDSQDGYTFLIYMNTFWNVEWGGNTVFFNDETKETAQVCPTPNLGILFHGSVLHYGADPSRHFNGLRMTVAYKLLEEKQ